MTSSSYPGDDLYLPGNAGHVCSCRPFLQCHIVCHQTAGDVSTEGNINKEQGNTSGACAQSPVIGVVRSCLSIWVVVLIKKYRYAGTAPPPWLAAIVLHLLRQARATFASYHPRHSRRTRAAFPGSAAINDGSC